MKIRRSRRSLLLGFSIVVLTTASCGLPRSGPSKKEVMSGAVEQDGNAFVVPVTDDVARATTAQPETGFSKRFRAAGLVGSDTIQPGDMLALTIWENVDNGLLASQGASTTQLAQVQVDGSGYIFVPYAGRIKAAGNTPDELRRIITAKLAPQTPDPQVSVSRAAGDGATVSVMGAIGGQGVYPIERPTRSLSAMIAKAGGVAVKPEIAKITVTRGKETGTVWLKDLYKHPDLDIALRSGDVILVEEDTRSFVSLGATGGQSRVSFDMQDLSALEAIATVGGLNSNLADPTGVFVLRDEPAETANSVLQRDDLSGPQRMVYVLDLSAPNGLFVARDFMIRDGDTVYVTEAPYVQWRKSLAVFTGTIGTASQIETVTNGN